MYRKNIRWDACPSASEANDLLVYVELKSPSLSITYTAFLNNFSDVDLYFMFIFS